MGLLDNAEEMSPGAGRLRTFQINGECSDRGARGYYGEDASSAAHPNILRRHRGANEQGERRVARHRIIFLGSGEREEDQDEAKPAQREQARACRRGQLV